MVRLKISLTEGEKKALLQLKVNKSFKTKSKITRRTLEVAKAFGIGVDDEKVFPIFKDFEIEVDPGDVVYITGESGSGKSVLLKVLARELSKHEEFGGVLTDGEIKVKPNEIVIHGVGRNASEAMRLLSCVGLNEAFLFLRRYKELSDGQKYRYKLAKAFWSGKRTLIFDEFCSILDRVTARVVAYLAQKFCRKNERTLIVATTHEDLLDDLNPDLLIKKSFGPFIEVRALNPSPKPCSVLKKIRIEEGSYEDYKLLAPFHYIGQRAGYIRKIFRAILDLDGEKELAGVIVYVHPYFELSARNLALPDLRRLRRRSGSSGYAKLIDKCFSRIARVIVHPKYRGIGLGTLLVRETMPLVGTPYVEALAVMARYNPFFEKAGMKRIEYASKAEVKIKKALIELEALGIQPNLINSKKYLRKMLKNSSSRRLRRIASIAKKIALQKLRRSSLLKRIEELDSEAIVEVLSKIRAKPEYFIWRNRKIKSPIE